MITVILNSYKRLNYLSDQLIAINSQSVKPSEIILWHNESSEKNILNLDPNIKYIYSSYNFGVWARFAAALNSKNDYICVFDDDTIPGVNWLKNCLETIQKKNGLLGTRGVRFASSKKYMVGEEFGWNNPNNEIKHVDIVGHSWFFKREWLSYFWRDLPDFNQFNLVGEDIHFSYVLQKYLGLKTYVPPHPINDKTMWGSKKQIAMELGPDVNAISQNSHNINEMNKCYLNYLKKGFKINFENELKYKKIYLENKATIGKHIKKFFNKQ